MAGVSAAEVSILLKAQDTASAAIQKVSGELGKLGAGAAGLGSQLKGVGDTIATATTGAALAGVVGLGAAFGTAVNSAMDFEKQMSAISAVSGATSSEMAALQQAALDLGAKTSFSAKEAADGIEELIKAGVSVADVLGGGAAAALDLAAAGGIKVGEAAEIASNAMNVFGLKGADMAHVADVIAGAANASAISVTDYKFSLAAAGAVAATVGVSFDDLSTAIAVMGNAGIKGSDAGTSLKTFLMNLTPSSKAATKAMRELGIITADGANKFFDATGKAKSMAEIAGVLQEATKNLTEQQKLQYLQTIFGSDAIRAAAVIAEAGASGFQRLATEIGKVTASQVAQERLNNLAGSLEQLKGSLETAAITVGLAFLPALRQIVDGITELVNGAMPSLQAGAEQAAATFTAWLPSIQAAAMALWDNRTAILQVVAAIAGLAILITVISWVSALAAVFTPLGLILTTITAAIVALSSAWISNWGDIQGQTTAALAAMQPTFDALVQWLEVAIPAALNWLATTGWPAFLTAATAVTEWIVSTAIPALISLGEWLGPKLAEAFTWLTETGWPGLVTAGEAFASWVTGSLIPGITTLIDWLGPKLAPVITWIYETGWPQLVAIGTQVITTVQGLIEFFSALFTEMEKRGVFEQLNVIWVQVNALGNTMAPIISNLTALWRFLYGILDLVLTGPARLLIAWFANIISQGPSAARAAEIVAQGIGAILAKVQGGIDLLDRFIRSLQNLSSIRVSIPSLPSLPGRAAGGPVSAGQAYWVGEKGPEVFVPATSGRIETMQDLGRMGSGSGASRTATAAVGASYIINVAGVGLEDVADEIMRKLAAREFLRGGV